jgi:photosystem II stability/assembly factor-like uncharacterized protein
MTHRLYVGTIGEGLFRSLDGGATFRRACDGMPFVECDVRALIVRPDDPATLYLGSEMGVFASRDGADSWSQLSALGDEQVWALWMHPARPERILAGTCPPGIWYSSDRGASWERARTTMTRDCPRIRHNRVTSLLGHPDDPDTLWAGVEIDGVHFSCDGGRTWSPLGDGLSSRDIHGLARVPTCDGETLLASTNNDLNRSTDGGNTWQPLRVNRSLPWPYCRGLAQKVGDPLTVLMGTGDGPPGAEGSVARSADGGITWELARLPGRTNSTVWNFAVHSSDPELIYAASVSGQVYRSADGGASWQKLAREFGEIRALAWTP